MRGKTRLVVDVALASVLAVAACSGHGEVVAAGGPSYVPKKASNASAVAAAGSGAPSGLGEELAGTQAGAGEASGMTGGHDADPLGAAGGDEVGCVEQVAPASQQRIPVDLVMVIDTASGMSAARNAMQDGLNAFATRVSDVGIDLHVVLLAATGPNNCFGPGLGVCVPSPLGSGSCGGGALGVLNGFALACGGGAIAGEGSDSSDRLLHLNMPTGSGTQLAALIEAYPQYQQLLRPEAHKYVVIVDDGQPLESAAQFEQALSQLDPPIEDGGWTFDAVYCQTSCGFLCPQASTGSYGDLVAQTGGVDGDLCDGGSAVDGLLDRLADAVIADAPDTCQWSIPAPPAGAMFDPNTLEVSYASAGAAPIAYEAIASDQCADVAGYYFDDDEAPTRIVLCPASCDQVRAQAGGELQVGFGCASDATK